MAVHTHNPSTWETEVGENQVQSQPKLHSMTTIQNKS